MQKNHLHTNNPDALQYESEELRFTVLGGVRMDGLDRLRVTIKIEVVDRKLKYHLNNPDLADLAMRHNVDLYNDTQVEKMIRKTAERMELGISKLTADIAHLTNELENFRLEQIEEKQQLEQISKQKRKLSEEEIQEAEEFLQSPNLIERTKEAIAKSGIVGELDNALRMLLIFTTRKREHPLHVISLGASGTGKTHLQEKVGLLIPEEDKIEITTLSDNAFYYFEKNELSNKLILIEDYDGVMSALYPIRELQSKKHITKTVTIKDSKGNTRTVHLRVEGPVCVAGCTTREQIYEDNANRSFLLYLDESQEQDERIMHYQRLQSAKKVNTEEEQHTRLLMQNAQRLLKPLAVVNPYAEQLKLPPEVLKPRRTNSHYLQFIEAVTFYHQYQRQWIDSGTGEIIYKPTSLERSEIPTVALANRREEIYIETTLSDIEEANKLMKEILLRKSDDISGAARNYLEQLKNYLQEIKQTSFSNKEIRAALRIPLSTLKRYHLELLNCDYLRLLENKKKKGYRYEVVSYEKYKDLQKHISGVLDKILEDIRLNSLSSAQLASEPIQPNATAESSQETKKSPKRSSGAKKTND